MSDPVDPKRTLFVADLADPRAKAAAMREPARTANQRDGRTTSDTGRGRQLGIVALLSAAGVAGAVAFVPGTVGARNEGPGPLTLAHQTAKLTCEACHASTSPGTPEHTTEAKQACVRCHGPHPSTRAGHKKLAKAGELGCTTCHAPHGPHQGVVFDGDGSAVRYGNGGETTVDGVSFRAHRRVLVPIIPAAACLGCHTTNPKDPFAQCLGSAGEGPQAVALCFDEHQLAVPPEALGRTTGSSPFAADAVCKSQHFPDRAYAWEAARAALVRVPWVSRGAKETHGAMLAAAGLAFGGLGFVVNGALRWFKRRRRASPAVAVKAAPKKRLPVIDTSTCLGCYACVDACPYGVLEVERYVAVVVRPDACCGLVLCEQRCPNRSLKMTDGEIIGDQPRLDASLESPDVPGLFLAGDVTGLPLIKNAILQGDHAATHALKRSQKPADGVFDVTIVGAGPSGISAALRAKEMGASFVVFEQGSVAESIKSFPRGKLIFDQPLEIPIAGKLWLKESTKEELLMHWMRIVRREELPIREGKRMTAIERRIDGTFEVRALSADGAIEEVVRSHAVILAIGRRGTPRKLPFPLSPEVESRVHYHLADARSLKDRRIVVAGIGDSAMEAAVALAQQESGEQSTGSLVTIVARAATYSRGQPRNINEVERLRKAGRLEVLWRTEVSAVNPGTSSEHAVALTLTADGASRQIEADALLVLIGTIPPWDTLAKAGVQRVVPSGAGSSSTS